MTAVPADAVPADAGPPPAGGLLDPPPTSREAELLALTLDILRETGYDKLTVDEVVARAHASKTTVYRRWPSKAELVCAALAYQVRLGAAPDTGSLRDDLFALAETVAESARRYAAIVAGILAAGQRSPQLRQFLIDGLYQDRRSQVLTILHRAAARGEIAAEAISEDIWDLLPAYLSYRIVQHDRPVTPATLYALVDELLMPSLTRLNAPPQS
jgi:AcrR family transcriptional regulator